jgi:hypothetical protein
LEKVIPLKSFGCLISLISESRDIEYIIKIYTKKITTIHIDENNQSNKIYYKFIQ